MRTDNHAKAVGAEHMPDMEDWWSEGANAPAPSQRNRTRHRAGRIPPPGPPPGPPSGSLPGPATEGVRRQDKRVAESKNRVLMYMTLAVLAVCLFMQVNRYAQIAAQTKHISRLVNEIKQLETEQNSLELRLSARQDISNVRDIAMYNLGMDYPSEGQVRVVMMGALAPEALSQMAAISADSAQ